MFVWWMANVAERSRMLGKMPMIPLRRSHHRLLLLLTPTLLAGCVIADGDGGRGGGFGGFDFGGGRSEVEYRCDNDRRFSVRYNDERAMVYVGNRTYRLRLEDRDGRRRQYGEGDVRLSVEGDEAYLRIKDERDYNDCEAR